MFKSLPYDPFPPCMQKKTNSYVHLSFTRTICNILTYEDISYIRFDELAYLIFKTPYLRDIQGKRSSSGTIIIVLNAWIKFDDLVIWPLKYLMIAFILPTLQRWLHEKLIQIYICAKTSWNWNPIYQAVMHYRKGEILTQSVRG